MPAAVVMGPDEAMEWEVDEVRAEAAAGTGLVKEVAWAAEEDAFARNAAT